MIVEEIMKTNLKTLSPRDTVKEALELMKEKHIRHIPIIDENRKLVGLVTSSTLKNKWNAFSNTSSSESEKIIEDVMIKDLITAHPLDFVEEIAITFYEMKISCLPIVSGGQLVGLVTASDLLYTYIELTGANKPSSKIDIRIEDKPGILSDILVIFKNHHANVLSVLLFPDSKEENYKIVTIRVQILNPLSIIEELKKAKFNVLWPNLPGITK
ncbi:acetoin utilization AcuB family protein [Ureibacillus manganicus]|uniref:Acetoin utilization protein AcuB n=1 Tax=Ureibacillus manganicus DSM 26584 TaxID=1384049 RepID=A0A0A3I205_9BACL|nr:acetoin utilization AcuB family protein [Ureibacillus manganicus]KGR77540.1 acetoin utilization protein AcuB [Ureibacillus manganicus DSM 26584]